jgi:membrane protein DedA with SNARE-associated domain
MKKTVTLLASALLTGVIFWLAIYSMNVIQHVPDTVKRSLSICGLLFTAVPVLIGVWLRRRRRNTGTE